MNRRVKTDGDLRKLLVKKPKGGRAGKFQADGWKGLLVFAEEYKEPGHMFAGNDGEPIPGSGNGRVFVYDKPLRKAGYEPLYRSRVLARRGDVVMEIWYVNNARRISEKAVMSLAERQLERL